MQLRSEVHRFVELMEAKLRANDHKVEHFHPDPERYDEVARGNYFRWSVIQGANDDVS